MQRDVRLAYGPCRTSWRRFRGQTFARPSSAPYGHRHHLHQELELAGERGRPRAIGQIAGTSFSFSGGRCPGQWFH
jgi:hypothetical protein